MIVRNCKKAAWELTQAALLYLQKGWQQPYTIF
jgi:hypothetical protein